MDALQPWTRLYEVMYLLGPLIAFSLALSISIYAIFAITFFIRSSRRKTAIPAPAGQLLPDDFGYMSGLSYLVMTSLFGIVLGMLIKLLGGFSVLDKGATNTLIGAIGTVLVTVLGVVGSVFAENGQIPLRRPLGAISFLISFLISGFYWKFLEKAPLL